MKISAAMIVRDGADTLERCLSSLKGYVDEIVIAIDSRTTDNTKEIAEQFGAITFPFDWLDSFSYARNLVGSKITADWIIWADADDWYDIETSDQFRDTVQKVAGNGIYLTVKTSQSTHHQSVRLYRPGSATWRGAVHEYLDFKNPNLVTLPFTVHHERGKIVEPGRNLKILEKQLTDFPRYLFYFGRECIDNGRPSDAITPLQQYIARSNFNRELVQAIYDVARAYYQMKDIPHCTEWCFNAIKKEPNFMPAYVQLGKIAYDSKNWIHVINWMESALNLPKIEYLFDSTEEMRFQAWDNLSLAYYYLGHYQKGYGYLAKCLKQRPNDPRLIDNKKYFDEKL